MSVIETRGLSKTYHSGGGLPLIGGGRSVTAIEDLDITVEAGEIFGFLGPNGAGKSTTINVLLDYVRPTEGHAEILGLDAQERPADVHDRIGVLPENTGLWDRLSARNHLQLAIRAKESDDDPEALLARVGLEDAVDRNAGGFSTGMRQRLGLAMALVGDPELLVLDEPTAGLDPNGVRLLRDILREEVDRGATVFFSSHVLEQVEAVCDRVAILRDGELVALDTIDQLRAELDAGTRLTATVDEVPDGVERVLLAVDGVDDVEVTGGRLVVECGTAEAKGRVVETIHEHGATVEDLDVDEPDLEALFAAIAGEDSEPAPEVDA